MKTLIVALNSKYIHTSLTPWYLKAFASNDKQLSNKIEVAEYTINDSLENILGSIYLKKPQVICFSCYIWNIDDILKLSEDLKKVLPECKIILGGPEVSFDSVEIMERQTSIGFIISGEGEKAFKELLKCIQQANEENYTQASHLEDINSLTYRIDNQIVKNDACSLIKDLDTIPSPFTDEYLSTLDNKIIYFETSRGCPFKCSYCLSSTISGVRYFSMERVKKDLLTLINWGTKQIKFVDRTFNSDKKRAKEILNFLIEASSQSKKDINFHFEMEANLFDQEMLDMLSKVPPGLMQFEIGVQTTNQETLKEIDRFTEIKTLKENVLKLMQMGNIHLHLDLIAGLPLEDYSSFKNSFNEVYNLKPHKLQLGFLKMLKGSKIREQEQAHGYRFRNYPPYEILNNNSMSYKEVLILKGVENLVEKYYNSGRFSVSLEYIIEDVFDSPFRFFYEFNEYNEINGYKERPMAAKDLYMVLYKFVETLVSKEKADLIKQLLKLDFLKCDSSRNLPKELSNITPQGFKEKCFAFLRNEKNIDKYLPEFSDKPAKEIYKSVYFQLFSHDVTCKEIGQYYPKREIVILFSYHSKDKVTGWFKYHNVNFQQN